VSPGFSAENLPTAGSWISPGGSGVTAQPARTIAAMTVVPQYLPYLRTPSSPESVLDPDAPANAAV
jgi:hypothetical protein